MKALQNNIALLFISSLLILFSFNTHANSYSKKHIKTNPLIFVHGGAGSASQFESQAMRFTSNGYPHNKLYALEYDSSFTIDTMLTVHSRLDDLITTVLANTGSDKVDLMGHSLGTLVLQSYLN
ncbi:MAG: hypothetical protein JKY66_05670, partial [Spongiibacteraceae bacterium]|nr:hypothetical protein [Spongiibacteraceae bacterium]